MKEKMGLKIPHFGEFKVKIEILSIYIFSVGNLQLLAPNLFNPWRRCLFAIQLLPEIKLASQWLILPEHEKPVLSKLSQRNKATDSYL